MANIYPRLTAFGSYGWLGPRVSLCLGRFWAAFISRWPSKISSPRRGGQGYFRPFHPWSMRPTRWWRAISPREKFSLCGALQPRAPSPRRRNPPHFPLTVLSSTPRSARRSAADPLSSASSARLVPSPVAGLTPCRRSATDSVKVVAWPPLPVRIRRRCFAGADPFPACSSCFPLLFLLLFVGSSPCCRWWSVFLCARTLLCYLLRSRRFVRSLGLPRVVATAASARLVVSWFRREHALSCSFLLICSSVLEATFGITPVLSYGPAIIAF
jgi:hypothetical protein